MDDYTDTFIELPAAPLHAERTTYDLEVYQHILTNVCGGGGNRFRLNTMKDLVRP